MDNKSDLFDLQREKQELDNFLSTITGSDESTTAPVKETAPVEETVPVKEIIEPKAPEPVEQIPEPEPPKPKPLASAPKFEDLFMQPPHEEKPAPPVFDFKPVQPVEEKEIKPTISSSFLPDLENKKEEPPSRIFDFQEPRAPEIPKVSETFDQMEFDDEIRTGSRIPEETAPVAEMGAEERKALEAALYEPSPVEKKAGKGKLIGGILALVVVVLLAGAFWLYSGPIMNVAKSIPGVGSLVKSLASAEKDVNLVNVRQHLVENKKTGKSFRVIEGVASNVSSNTISNIKIVAALIDAEGKELVSMESVAGNILMDEKLENMDASAVKTALLTTRGAQDKVPPQGQIPFMIVFTSEPAGVFKMSVTPVAFTKQ